MQFGEWLKQPDCFVMHGEKSLSFPRGSAEHPEKDVEAGARPKYLPLPKLTFKPNSAGAVMMR